MGRTWSTGRRALALAEFLIGERIECAGQEIALKFARAYGEENMDDMTPAAAAIKKAMNIMGKTLQNITEAYPDQAKYPQILRDRAAELRSLAEEVEQLTEPQKWIDLEYSIRNDSILNLLNTKLLQPVADAQKAGATDADLKSVAVNGILELAKSLEKDAG